MLLGGRRPDDPNVGNLLIGRTVATFMFFSAKGSPDVFYQHNILTNTKSDIYTCICILQHYFFFSSSSSVKVKSSIG